MRNLHNSENKKEKLRFSLIQSAVIAACVLICFLISFVTLNGLLIASLAASSFIAFAFPTAHSGRYRFLAGGYACGIAGGIAGSFLSLWVASFAAPEVPVAVIFCVVAVFAAAFLMLFFDFEHPPAAALAVAIVLDATPLYTSLVAMASILVVCLLKFLFLRAMRERLE